MVDTQNPLIAEIEQTLQSNFENLHLVKVIDLSGGCDGSSLQVIVITDEFKEMKLLERQQKVNQILSAQIAKLHAMELKTWTVEQWDKKKDQFANI